MIFPAVYFLLALSSLVFLDMSAHYRIMTFNIRRDGVEKDSANFWSARLPRIVDVISDINPDIIGMQEPINTQVQDLRASLLNYTQIGQSRSSCWWGIDTDEFNPIWFKTELFALKDSGTFAIDGSPSRWERIFKKHKYGLLNRICTWALLEDKKTGQCFYVFNTHLDHMYDQARCFGISAILHTVQQRSFLFPVVLMGDFNADIDGGLKGLLGAAQFKNTKLLAEKSEGPENTYTGFGRHQECLIDHILVLGNVTVQKQATIPEGHNGYPSDHRPVYAELNFLAKN